MEYSLLYFLPGKFSVANNVFKKEVERLERDWGITVFRILPAKFQIIGNLENKNTKSQFDKK